jgi:xanthosine utilization system XapX-like protein
MVQRLMRWVVLLLALILLIRLANPPRLALLVSFMGFFIGYTLLCVIALRNE